MAPRSRRLKPSGLGAGLGTIRARFTLKPSRPYTRAALSRSYPADAWLAALAMSLDYEITTFDRGFKSFRGLRLRLLSMADK